MRERGAAVNVTRQKWKRIAPGNVSVSEGCLSQDLLISISQNLYQRCTFMCSTDVHAANCIARRIDNAIMVTVNQLKSESAFVFYRNHAASGAVMPLNFVIPFNIVENI